MTDQGGVNSDIVNPIRVSEDDSLGAIFDTPPLPHGGHCLFVVGNVSAGKSTLQHALIHRLYTDERIDLTFRNEAGDTHQDPALQDWIFRFDRGEFPERTPREYFQTFFIEFGQRQILTKLSFVEISGEHFRQILPSSSQRNPAPQLDPKLEHILTTQAVKKFFIFLADTTRHDPAQVPNKSSDDRDQDLYEDMMFSCLLNRLRALGLNRIKILIAATKWDKAPNRNLDPERFFRRHFPGARAALRRFQKAQVQYIRFSIGNVQIDESGNSGVSGITKADFVPIERVIQWIHTQATGKSLKGYPAIRPALWEKIKGWAAS